MTIHKSTGHIKLNSAVVISIGPDWHVYLFKEIQPVNFLNLGKLKRVSGNQLYAITGTPDFKGYKIELLQGQVFNHLLGSALFMEYERCGNKWQVLR